MKPSFSWVVGAGAPRTVGAFLAGRPGWESARIVRNGCPASLDDAIEEGDRIDLHPHRESPDQGIEVLARHEGLVLVAKPAGLPTESTRQGDVSVVSELQRILGGEAVHAATRLDVPVSGIVACCLGRDARRRFERWRDRSEVRRAYLALARTAPLREEGDWTFPLARGKDRAGRDRMQIGGPEASEASTHFRVIARAALVLLELTPRTGRMHQLRAHAAAAGVPLVGDRLYGGPLSVVGSDGRVLSADRVALHCARLEVPGLAASARVPDDLRRLWQAAGGDEGAWPAP